MFRIKKMKQKKKQTNKKPTKCFSNQKNLFSIEKKNNVASNNCSVNIKMQSQIHTT